MNLFNGQCSTRCLLYRLVPGLFGACHAKETYDAIFTETSKGTAVFNAKGNALWFMRSEFSGERDPRTKG